MHIQPELNLAEPQALTESDRASLDHLVEYLDSIKRWVTAGELLEIPIFYSPNTESSRRWLRNLAANSDGQILSGQRGYRHIRHATPDEIDHAANWLEHQAQTMGHRARSIRARAIRRRRPYCGDIDLVILPKPGMLQDLQARFKRHCVAESEGPQNAMYRLPNGVQIDAFFAWESDDFFTGRQTNFGTLLLCRTGSRQHNIWLIEHSKRLDTPWHPYVGVIELEKGTTIASATEEDIFRALKLDYLPPEQRERCRKAEDLAAHGCFNWAFSFLVFGIDCYHPCLDFYLEDGRGKHTEVRIIRAEWCMRSYGCPSAFDRFEEGSPLPALHWCEHLTDLELSLVFDAMNRGIEPDKALWPKRRSNPKTIALLAGAAALASYGNTQKPNH